ncbi:MAG TPA: 16S rRNA (adenine(1518)-N(6)/adenine(1519)-N(6))-dimethyltransferase RsmA [Myxococcota bacterium]|nr:16S rRNA (adenine(1518)-N(6)/adenine(1519)-N(6))-dimethyltransferase RsmA [Myxococcota bacterium]
MTDDPRAILQELERGARKRFGQHFLARPDVVRRIVRMAGVQPGDRVVEVGPGLGVLTRALVEAGAQVVAVEVDGDLVEHLRTAVPEVELHHADATRVDWGQVAPGSGWKLVANLPYNVGTGIVMDAVREPGRFRSLTVMLQAEVVARMVAAAGTDPYGALSVQLQARARATAWFDVPPSAFVPPPKVVSTVVRIDVLERPDAGPAGADALDRVVRSAFARRRKMLRNSLAADFGRERVEAALAVAGVEGTRRAEEIDLRGFQRIAAALDDAAGEGADGA